ncbi:MAG: TadA family conjugal transfer-associated ATPase [Frankia sp.]
MTRWEATPGPVEPARVDRALVDGVRRRLAGSGAPATSAQVAAALSEEAGPHGDRERLALTAALRSELAGLGPLEPLLADPRVTDILVNAPADVWVDGGDGLRRSAISFEDDEAVRRLAVRLAVAAGRRLDTASPFVDARLPDGSRLHAVLPPIASRGTCLSLRIPRHRGFTLAGLATAGSLAPGMYEVLEAVVAARLPTLVSGGTGSGKTTLLGALCGLVDPSERLVIVEDAAELAVGHPHAVRLEARPPNVEGAGAVGLRDLVRQALRMRPDRLVVGEVRGPEVVDLLVAFNTGHEGGMSTVHANSPRDVPARMEALAALAGLGREALHSQLAAAVATVVHLDRPRDGTRAVAEIAVLVRGPDQLVRSLPAVRRVAEAPGSNLVLADGAPLIARMIHDRGVTPPEILLRPTAGSGAGSVSPRGSSGNPEPGDGDGHGQGQGQGHGDGSDLAGGDDRPGGAMDGATSRATTGAGQWSRPW